MVGITWLEMPKDRASAHASEATKPLEWFHDEQAAVSAAREGNKPLMIDFTADWCAACKRLARETFPESSVRSELERFVLLEVDATNDDDPKVIEVQKRYRVVGLPTVILIDSDGKEVRRFTDFVPPGRFLPVLKDVK